MLHHFLKLKFLISNFIFVFLTVRPKYSDAISVELALLLKLLFTPDAIYYKQKKTSNNERILIKKDCPILQ